MKAVYYPARLLWLVPVFALAMQFENPDMLMWFTFIMAFVTSKIFPWVEYVKEKKETE